jgi:hypothetical protein
MWHLPESNLGELMGELENRFSLIFQKLNVTGTTDLVEKFVVNPSPDSG